MLIDELFEANGFWKGVGSALAQRYTPGVDYNSKSPAYAQTFQKGAAKAGQAAGQMLPKPPVAAQKPAVPIPSPIPAAKDYSQYQTPTVFRQGAQIPSVPNPTVQQPQTTVAKPRVPTQPIRVGNKVYRPGDPMHARLWQMMQAQGRS